jgi:uncharacterized protein YlxP (DUF503 family)
VLAFDESFSLKDKRRILKSVMEVGRRRHHVSICEVGFHDTHRTGELAAAFVDTVRADIEAARSRFEDFLHSSPEYRVESIEWQWL